jgi:hypothetical protein
MVMMTEQRVSEMTGRRVKICEKKTKICGTKETAKNSNKENTVKTVRLKIVAKIKN